MKKIIYVILFCFIGLGVVSCQKKGEAESKPTVLVSVAPYLYFVKEIAGTTVEVFSLVPERVNPHIYDPSPKEIQHFHNAQIYFRLGELVDQKLTPALKERNPQLKIVELTQGIPLLAGCEHHPESKDLHIWLSPILAKKQAETIAQALIVEFPEHQALYQQNLENLLSRLAELNQTLSQVLEPVKGEMILVSHPAFAYFCANYGLTQLSIEIDGKEPRPQDISRLIQVAKNSQIVICLLQPQYSNKGAELVAEELRIRTAYADPYAQDYIDNLLQIAHSIAYAKTHSHH